MGVVICKAFTVIITTFMYVSRLLTNRKDFEWRIFS